MYVLQNGMRMANGSRNGDGDKYESAIYHIPASFLVDTRNLRFNENERKKTYL